MIDWLDFVVDCLHDPIPAGRVLSITPDGTLEFDIPKRMRVSGSYESNIYVRSQGGSGDGRATELYISGNPSKFLQGHNVFGTDDITGLAAATVRKIFASLDLSSDLTIAKVVQGNFYVKRIDITRSYAFSNRVEVQAVLSSLAVSSRSRMGRAQTRGGTVYHGKNSKRHSFKFYCKAEELEAGKKHRLPEELNSSPIKEFSENLLRAELTLRSKELNERNISMGSELTPRKIKALYDEYFGRIEVSAQATIPSTQICNLQRAIRDSYLMWSTGIDPRPMMSKSTFYRHRCELLGYGIDISLPKDDLECQVIPLFRQVTGSPVGVPGWAYEQSLVFDPNRIGG